MVTMKIKDIESGEISKEVSMEDLIFNQNEIEFEFGEYEDENYSTLPYKDFLFFKDDYEVIVHTRCN